MEDPDILSNFLSITGCEDSSLATTILENNNWDVERSVDFFFAMNDSGSTKPSSNNNNNNNSESGTGTGNKTSSPASSYDYDDDDIREPIPQRMETLVDQMGESMPSRPNRYQKPGNVFEVFRDFEKEGRRMGGMDKDKLTDKQKTLAELFKPPLDILTFGTFDAVKKIGEQKKQFILVNIQDVSEFDCQKLNRDTWSNKDLKDLISENFVFWQVSNQNSEGNWFTQIYPVYKFPYIAIIDPRTGQKLQDMFGFADAEEMAQYLVTFLSQNSYNGSITTSTINVNSNNSNNSSSNNGNGDVASKKQRKYSTEDEELELAIQLSLKQDQERAKNNSPPQDNKSPPLTNNNNNNINNTSATTTTTNTTSTTAAAKDQLKNSKESIKKSSGDNEGEEEDEEFEENYDEDEDDIDNYDDNYFYGTTVEKTKSEEEVKKQEIKQLVEKVQESSKIGTEGDCTIQIRCPTETLKGQFHSTDQIKTLYYYVQVKTGLANFKLLTSYPKVELVGDIMTKTLKEMDLAPRAVIMLQQN